MAQKDFQTPTDSPRGPPAATDAARPLAATLGVLVGLAAVFSYQGGASAGVGSALLGTALAAMAVGGPLATWAAGEWALARGAD